MKPFCATCRARRVGSVQKPQATKGPGVSRLCWDGRSGTTDGLRDIVRNHVQETLSDKDAVLVVDETGFLKKGKASCGVGRQYTGSAGKITNCQIGVFAVYVSSRGHAFVDRALYLPKAWSTDPTRLTSASVPESRMFATKPILAREIIERGSSINSLGSDLFSMIPSYDSDWGMDHEAVWFL